MEDGEVPRTRPPVDGVTEVASYAGRRLTRVATRLPVQALGSCASADEFAEPAE